MKTLATKIAAIIFISFIFIPFAAWSVDLKSLEKQVSDPCFKANCDNVKDYIENLKKAVKAGNKKEVANYMAFPLRINKTKNGKKFYYEVNEKEFIQQYHSIITKDVEYYILKSDVKNIIPNYQGIGIASGTLWLSGDIPPIGAFVINVN